MKRLNKFTIIISLLCMHFIAHATLFDIETVRVGPNPLLQGKDPLMINYVASLPHSSEYHLYSVTGELIIKKTFNENTPSITQAGECKFSLLSAMEMAKIPKQLYVVIGVFQNGTKKIKKKKYVIVK